jgi:hypothetical protein
MRRENAVCLFFLSLLYSSVLGGTETLLGITRERKKDYMPRSPRHILVWSQEHTRYELFTAGQLTQRFRREDEHLWLSWLKTATSFTFCGPDSRLNVYQEARPRGGVYWYAYHATSNRTRKRYLGRTTNVTFGCLEEVAEALHLWQHDEARLLHTWIQALPEAVLRNYTGLALDTALRCLQTAHATVKASYARTLTQVEETIARVEAGVYRSQEPVLPEEKVALVERRLRLLRVLIASKTIILRGDKERLRLLAQEVEGLAENEEMNWKMVGLYLSFLLISIGDPTVNREETCEQSSRETGSRKPYPGHCTSASVLPALKRSLQPSRLIPWTNTPSGRLLTTVWTRNMSYPSLSRKTQRERC